MLTDSQKRVEREELSKYDLQVEEEIVGIKQQYAENKQTVLKNLLDVIVDVKLDVPAVVKAKFNVQQAPDEWNDVEVM